MKFETYAMDWLGKQGLIKSTKKTTRQALDVYILPVIGEKEIADIREEDVDAIFLQDRLVKRGPDFTERTFRVLTAIWDQLDGEGYENKVLHLYSPVVFSHEKKILAGWNVELARNSMFVDVSCSWLRQQGYAEVTYNLYYHFLLAFIHPFIGNKPIGLISQVDIRKIYQFFNTVNTNNTWITQIHLVMRMVFQYALDIDLITESPLTKVNDPYLKPIVNLTREQKNKVRYAFGKYGFRKNRLRYLSKELFSILVEDEEVQNGASENNQSFRQICQKWFTNTQEGILADNTSKSVRYSMEIYPLPCFGEKPMKEVSPSDIMALKQTFALMGNTSDYYLIARLQSIFEYARERGIVERNIVKDFKCKESSCAKKYVLSDVEIKKFFKLCEESMYGCMLAVALCNGLRIREAMALRYSNLDSNLKTIKVVNQMKDGILLHATKTRQSRKLKLSETALAFITRAKSYQQQYKETGRYRNELGLIFTTDSGKPLSYTNTMRKLDEIQMKMGRADITPHILRHTYLTISTRCGESLDEIQRTAGHGYTSTVIREYLHQTQEGWHDAAENRQRYLTTLMQRYQEE